MECFMTFFYPLTNVTQDYPWGSATSIPSLFDVPNPTSKPMAEIWMGAHPKASSLIEWQNELTPLRDVIEQDPDAFIGESTFSTFGELPFLFKVLAAEKALSIQVHPTKFDAEVGYERENVAGIPLDAYNRNYKDANHKPELVYALTPYLAMNGFREFEEVIELFSEVNLTSLSKSFESFSLSPDSAGLKQLFEQLLTLDEKTKNVAIAELINWAKSSSHSLAEFILDLNYVYPGDVGLLSPLLLNVVLLKPGEAMFLHAGTPHAYVKGTALEIMANSDNVLRAGLTPKFIDVPELIASCVFEPLVKGDILTKPSTNGVELNFPVPVQDFSFSVLKEANETQITPERAEIWFAIDSDVTFTHPTGEVLTVSKGQSVFIPISSKAFTVSCAGTVARAF